MHHRTRYRHQVDACIEVTEVHGRGGALDISLPDNAPHGVLDLQPGIVRRSVPRDPQFTRWPIELHGDIHDVDFRVHGSGHPIGKLHHPAIRHQGGHHVAIARISGTSEEARAIGTVTYSPGIVQSGSAKGQLPAVNRRNPARKSRRRNSHGSPSHPHRSMPPYLRRGCHHHPRPWPTMSCPVPIPQGTSCHSILPRESLHDPSVMFMISIEPHNASPRHHRRPN